MKGIKFAQECSAMFKLISINMYDTVVGPFILDLKEYCIEGFAHAHVFLKYADIYVQVPTSNVIIHDYTPT
jgi:hypothetical protein